MVISTDILVSDTGSSKLEQERYTYNGIRFCTVKNSERLYIGLFSKYRFHPFELRAQGFQQLLKGKYPFLLVLLVNPSTSLF